MGFRRILFAGIVFISASLSIGLAEDEARVAITPRVPLGRELSGRRSGNIRLDVKVVLIPVSVADIWDRPIAGLREEDFHLYEDNVEQQIAYLSNEEAPASVGLIFDSSGSMANKIET